MASRGEIVLGETAKSAVGGSILGALGGVVVGALTGALSMAVPALIAAGVGALGAVATTAVAYPASVGATALLFGGVTAAIGAVPGAIAGLGVGAGVGGAFFGARGALAGARMADEDKQLEELQKQNFREARQNSISMHRAQAAEQYTALGYANGLDDGVQLGEQQAIRRIIAAHQQKLSAAGGQHSFAATCGKQPTGANGHAAGATAEAMTDSLQERA